MIWNEYEIKTNPNGVDILTEKLSAIGIDGLVTENPEELKALLEDKTVPWDYVDESLLSKSECTVKFYLSDSAADKEKAASVLALLDKMQQEDVFPFQLEKRRVDDADWADNWKQYFHPLEIGKRIVIRPSWEEYDSKGADKIVLELDPSSSFGTGQHETTALCLEILEQYMDEAAQQGKQVKLLDMGCGSGILSIAGLLLGAQSAAAVDIDENAARIAAENAAKNGVAQRYTAYYGDVLSNKYLRTKLGVAKYDLILANIVADVIISMADLFHDFAADGATLVCSGIIAPKSQSVVEALTKSGFVLSRSFQKNDWVALEFKKN